MEGWFGMGIHMAWVLLRRTILAEFLFFIVMVDTDREVSY